VSPPRAPPPPPPQACTSKGLSARNVLNALVALWLRAVSAMVASVSHAALPYPCSGAAVGARLPERPCIPHVLLDAVRASLPRPYSHCWAPQSAPALLTEYQSVPAPYTPLRLRRCTQARAAEAASTGRPRARRKVHPAPRQPAVHARARHLPRAAGARASLCRRRLRLVLAGAPAAAAAGYQRAQPLAARQLPPGRGRCVPAWFLCPCSRACTHSCEFAVSSLPFLPASSPG
jgi:hypothetical protein